MKKRSNLILLFTFIALISFGLIASPANALLINVSGGTSNLGALPAIIAAPSDALDDFVTNIGMQGFDERQGFTTTVAHSIDGGGTIAAGTTVDSHMIFLNSVGGTLLHHGSVVWTFDRNIIGVMSDSSGSFEAASTVVSSVLELGAPTTNYTVTFVGSGPAAPYGLRGLEGQAGGFSAYDGYTVSGNSITVGMRVTEPGDWIRVVTAGEPVPEPATMLLLGSGLVGLAGFRRKKKK